jgi:P27 family predicted phage terminase small subunit
MGRRGPAPTPTKVKLLHGETRPSRVNYREPIPSSGLPRMPGDMDPEAKRVWRRIIRTMGDTGVIRAVDQDVLRCYCESVSRYIQAMRLYSGPLLKSDRGPVRNPLHQIVRENSDAVRQFARELGLSPSSRSGLLSAQENPGDSFGAGVDLPPRLRAISNAD